MSVLNYIYHAAIVFVRRNDDRFLSTIARITGIGLKLLLLMTLYRYIATTTNNLSSDKTFGGVSSVSALNGLPVASIEFYKNTIYSVHAHYKYFPDVWDRASLLKEINSAGIIYFLSKSNYKEIQITRQRAESAEDFG